MTFDAWGFQPKTSFATLIVSGQATSPTVPPFGNKGLIRPYKGKPMADKPLLRPYFWGGSLPGARLTSHNLTQPFRTMKKNV